MTTPSDARSALSPPYLPFKTFVGFLDDLKDKAVPQRIDNSIMRNYSGSMKTQLRTALRFFVGIDESGTVLPRLRELVAARGTPEWKPVFSNVFFQVYSDVVGDLDIDSGTLQQLKDRFRAAGVEGSSLIKSVRFYIAALDDTGTKYSPYFKSRGLSTGVRSTPKPKPKGSANTASRQPNDSSRSNGTGSEQEQVLPQGWQRFTLPIKGRAAPATIIVPEDMKLNEWMMLEQYVRMYFGYAD